MIAEPSLGFPEYVIEPDLAAGARSGQESLWLSETKKHIDEISQN
jgi:hypothetical protein